jgi:hypothetical protein
MGEMSDLTVPGMIAERVIDRLVPGSGELAGDPVSTDQDNDPARDFGAAMNVPELILELELQDPRILGASRQDPG